MTYQLEETRRHRLTRYSIVTAIVVVVAAMFAYQQLSAPVDDAVVGNQRLELDAPAPDFVLNTLDGTFRLSEARGDIVVVNFWATWCGPCRFEMPEFQALHRDRGEADGIRVVAVNLTRADSRDAVLEFVDDFGLTFTIAFDETGSVADDYGVHSLPATFFIDREGILRSRSYGPVLGERLDAALALVGG